MKTFGLIGLSESAFLLAQTLRKKDFTFVIFDFEHDNRKRAADEGFVTTSSVQAVVLHLPPPKIVVLMLQEAPKTRETVAQLTGLLEAGDVVAVGLPQTSDDYDFCHNLLKDNGISFLQTNFEKITEGQYTEIRADQTAYAICKPIFEALSAQPD